MHYHSSLPTRAHPYSSDLGSNAARCARRLPARCGAGICGPPAECRAAKSRAMSDEHKRVERHLAAIFAADVASYSRLMGADEPGTLRALRTHRAALIDPLLSAHKGRLVKTTGD